MSETDAPTQLLCIIQFEFTVVDDGLWIPYSTKFVPSTVSGVNEVSNAIVSPIQFTLSELDIQVGSRLATALLAEA